jgi:hypothetical protein
MVICLKPAICNMAYQMLALRRETETFVFPSSKLTQVENAYSQTEQECLEKKVEKKKVVTILIRSHFAVPDFLF